MCRLKKFLHNFHTLQVDNESEEDEINSDSEDESSNNSTFDEEL